MTGREGPPSFPFSEEDMLKVYRGKETESVGEVADLKMAIKLASDLRQEKETMMIKRGDVIVAKLLESGSVLVKRSFLDEIVP